MICHVRDEIKRLSQGFADRMEKHANILATKDITQIKKKTCAADSNSIGHMLFKIFLKLPHYY